MSQNSKLDKSLYSLPFDQFSRQLYVSEIIGLIRSTTKVKELSILDIGGYKGKTQEFQYNDKVLVADLFNVHEENYVQVNPDKLPFKDDEFDVSVSFDTYEHVPRDNRRVFIDEALRVSKTFHILAAPVDNQVRDVNRAEVIANESYKKMKGDEHRWLKEHIDYLIPTREEIEEDFSQAGVYYTSLSTNELSLWLQLQQFFFCAEINSECFEQVEKINSFFNKNLNAMEANIESKNAYRRIYCITKDKDHFERFERVFKAFKSELYSSVNIERQTSAILELDSLIHNGYMLLKTLD